MPRVTCDWCGKSCYKTPYDLSNFAHKFCSKACQFEWMNRNHVPNTTCQNCGKEYWKAPAYRTLRPGQNDFCSPTCKHAWQSRNKVERTCEKCGKTFYVSPSSVEYHGCRFCSLECAGTAVERVEHECEQCHKSYKVPPNRATITRFCSRECRCAWESEYRRGPNNPHWRGGPIRDYGENWLRQRRRAIDRDGGCRLCGAKNSTNGYELDVHHIRPIREFPTREKANYLANLITLCRICHAKVHSGQAVLPSP
jgi:hypothetical protein